MKLNKIIVSMLLFALAVSFCASRSAAQSKVIKKTVKKVVIPQISPAQPPQVEASKEVVPEVPPPPPPEPSYEVQVLEEDRGIFGWGLNTDIGAKLLFGSLLLGVRGDIIFSDPLMLGEKIGLAEDAVEYKLGLGFALADTFKSVPLFADAVVYLKEGSLFGMDPYIGAGLNYNLYGTDKVTGGLGGQVYLGILADLGMESGRTGIALGYGSHKVAEAHSASGITVSIAQPLKL